ncbi:hypothetical protein PFICI_11520 [Pestalotiopsis fici W106-1]|uniref:Uncharacterized protein n=1 Tax=Pestalotiopsis fici (strain W106-1 / CGMCC3.15140) TaxID=1229662 RepID=W3WQL1_PESFW|nr:uncharacterized protein PFICI_11520 [Pestalotiopsis fici W106-1]ETS76133.1 hypothetical protein PFICI_11520 [Pestalotiopsis fici W106-1]
MVSIKTLAGAALAAALPASAYVNGISGPETAAAGSSIDATVTTSIYVQNWVDYSIIWGLAPATYNCAEYKCIGQQIGYSAAYPDQLPLGNFSVALAIPEVSAGDYQLFAAVPYLVGASGTVDVETFYYNITITA